MFHHLPTLLLLLLLLITTQAQLQPQCSNQCRLTDCTTFNHSHEVAGNIQYDVDGSAVVSGGGTTGGGTSSSGTACQWNIECPTNSAKFQIQFASFDGNEENWLDYVEIKNLEDAARNGGGTVMATFRAGRTITSPWGFDASYVQVTYRKSPQSGSRFGFYLNYTCTLAPSYPHMNTCTADTRSSVTLDDPSGGNITHSGVWAGEECEWDVMCPPGTLFTVVEGGYFQVGTSRSGQLQIYSYDAPTGAEPFKTYFGATSFDSAAIEQYRSAFYRVRVQLIDPAISEAFRLKLSYKCLPNKNGGGGANPADQPTYTCPSPSSSSSTDGGEQGSAAVISIQNISSQYGKILVTGTYEASTQCMWFVSCAPGTFFQISFAWFDTEGYFDTVDLFDASTASISSSSISASTSTKYRLSSFHGQDRVVSSWGYNASKVLVRFKSDETFNADGFSLDYTCTPTPDIAHNTACTAATLSTEMLTAISGNISHDRGFGTEEVCQWQIVCPPKSKVKLTGGFFEGTAARANLSFYPMPASLSSSDDSLVDSSSSSALWSFIDTVADITPVTLNASSVSAVFLSSEDEGEAGSGFVVKYSCEFDSSQTTVYACNTSRGSSTGTSPDGGAIVITDQEGVISHVGSYDNSELCSWVVQCPVGSFFQISTGFVETEAAQDYVHFYNADTGASMGAFHGGRNFSDWGFNAQVVRIVWSSDATITNGRGFLFNYACTANPTIYHGGNCTAPTKSSETLTALQGDIIHKSGYFPDEMCNWYVKCPRDRNFAITAGSIYMQSLIDKIQIFDYTDGQRGDNIYTYRSSADDWEWIEPRVFDASEVRITFTAESTLPYDGFAFSYVCTADLPTTPIAPGSASGSIGGGLSDITGSGSQDGVNAVACRDDGAALLKGGPGKISYGEYGAEVFCTWIVDCPPSTSFAILNGMVKTEAKYDTLKIKADIPLEEYSGSAAMTPRVYYGKSTVDIFFKTDATTHGQGFELFYECSSATLEPTPNPEGDGKRNNNGTAADDGEFKALGLSGAGAVIALIIIIGLILMVVFVLVAVCVVAHRRKQQRRRELARVQAGMDDAGHGHNGARRRRTRSGTEGHATDLASGVPSASNRAGGKYAPDADNNIPRSGDIELGQVVDEGDDFNNQPVIPEGRTVGGREVGEEAGSSSTGTEDVTVVIEQEVDVQIVNN